MSTNFAVFLSVRMIVRTETALVLIHAHAKLGGPALIVLIVFVYQAAKTAFVIYPLNVNAVQGGPGCSVTSVSDILLNCIEKFRNKSVFPMQC